MTRSRLLDKLDRSSLTVIAGPCMFESKALAREVLEFMKAECATLGVTYVFKSSFDKANRTSANSVRGPGLQALAGLAELRETYQVPVLTDIHSPQQAAAAAESVDILQIPAFLCEDWELLRAAAKTGRILQIKKGQYLAPERMVVIKQALESVPGCGQIVFCERGTTQGYHNLVVDFRNLDIMNTLGTPVVFDATHSVQLPGAAAGASSGKREHIPALARAAAAVGIDGLFMEVHPNPSTALSDKDTQLNPQEARAVLKQVVAIDRIRRQLPLAAMVNT
jgi:2-dehydro-3-deoxyphosphooctonate aldolase (KDO 8-P synthase)